MSSIDPHARTINPSLDLRDRLHERLPEVLASFFTYLTGLAPLDRPPLQRSDAGLVIQHLATFFVALLSGSLAVPLLGVPGALLLPLIWTLSVGEARYLQLVVYHHAAHGTVVSPAWSEWIGRWIGRILLIEPFDSYAPSHRREHHGRHAVSTRLDPTVRFLIEQVGIRPGASRWANRREILLALVSPRLHTGQFVERIASQARVESVLSGTFWLLLYWIGLIAGIVALAGWIGFLLGVAIPLGCGYQAAQVLRLVVEHRWPEAPPARGKRSAAEHDALTVAIRCAVAPPARWTPGSFVDFWLRTLGNAWIRWTVLPGDSGPSHHWHHGEARGDWANHVTAAAAWAARRQAKGAAAHAEAIGFGAAFDLALTSFSNASWESIAIPERTGDRRSAR